MASDLHTSSLTDIDTRTERVADAIWNALNLGLILLNEDGKVILWNSWIARHSGIPAEFAVGHSLESLFPTGLSASFKTAIKNALLHKLPIVLSNALHQTPLPLFPLPITPHTQARIQQSTSITPIVSADGEHLCLIQITDTSMSIKRERVLKLHSDQLGIAATTDSLTGAYNRRFFEERYAAEFGRAQRTSTALSLLMLDVDFFKNYNDHYGHPAGDKVLIAVVESIKSKLNRATDVLTRYGGEEFAVILPDCRAEGSRTIADKIRLAINALNIPHSASKICDHITVSIGGTTLEPGTHCNTDCLLSTADKALYLAKHKGRNCAQYIVTPDCQKPCPEQL